MTCVSVTARAHADPFVEVSDTPFLVEDASGTYWFSASEATCPHLRQYDGFAFVQHCPVLPTGAYVGYYSPSVATFDTSIWIGTSRGGGVLRRHRDRWTVFTPDSGLAG